MVRSFVVNPSRMSVKNNLLAFERNMLMPRVTDENYRRRF